VSAIYDQPELYELACAYRDVPAEVDAVTRWFRRHARLAGTPARNPASVLEIAAGPAEHALEFARRGASATALDLSEAMCARARDKARQEGLRLAVVRADMRDFSIEPPADLLITMLNSVCHLMSLDDLLAHLRAAAAHTVAGGLYIMELAHPADFLSRAPRTSAEWDSDVGQRHVHVRWGGADDPIDPVTQVSREHVQITVRDGEGSRTLTDVVPNRFWTATEITAATRLAGGFTVTASYGDFADGVAVGAPSAWRMIMVLRRSQASGAA
jgi:SAM-dependent methyltransferase